jgi:hypothetical protein
MISKASGILIRLNQVRDAYEFEEEKCTAGPQAMSNFGRRQAGE